MRVIPVPQWQPSQNGFEAPTWWLKSAPLMRCVMRLESGSRMNDGRCRRASRVELPLDHMMEGGHALAFEAAGVVSSVQLWPSRE